jgi:hypothetical protein
MEKDGIIDISPLIFSLCIFFKKAKHIFFLPLNIYFQCMNFISYKSCDFVIISVKLTLVTRNWRPHSFLGELFYVLLRQEFIQKILHGKKTTLYLYIHNNNFYSYDDSIYFDKLEIKDATENLMSISCLDTVKKIKSKQQRNDSTLRQTGSFYHLHRQLFIFM